MKVPVIDLPYLEGLMTEKIRWNDVSAGTVWQRKKFHSYTLKLPFFHFCTCLTPAMCLPLSPCFNLSNLGLFTHFQSVRGYEKIIVTFFTSKTRKTIFLIFLIFWPPLTTSSNKNRKLLEIDIVHSDGLKSLLDIILLNFSRTFRVMALSSAQSAP